MTLVQRGDTLGKWPFEKRNLWLGETEWPLRPQRQGSEAAPHPSSRHGSSRAALGPHARGLVQVSPEHTGGAGALPREAEKNSERKQLCPHDFKGLFLPVLLFVTSWDGDRSLLEACLLRAFFPLSKSLSS